MATKSGEAWKKYYKEEKVKDADIRESQRKLQEYIDSLKPGYEEKRRSAKEEARRKKPVLSKKRKAKKAAKEAAKKAALDKKAKDEKALSAKEEARRKKPVLSKKRKAKKAAKKADIEGTGPVSKERTKQSKVNREGSDRMIAAKEQEKEKEKAIAKEASKKVDTFKSIPTPDVESFQGAASVKVKKGDTLSAIAKRMNTTIAALKEANDIKNINMIRIGQTIKAPKVNVAASPYKGMKKGELSESKKEADQAKSARLEKRLSKTIVVDPSYSSDFQSGGVIGQSDMSAKRVTAPKKNKKKVPQYYKGGGAIKKKYAYGGRVAKYKG